MQRARAVNDAAPFLGLMADVVRATCARHAARRRLPVVPGAVGKDDRG
jgi:hypothetical protein